MKISYNWLSDYIEALPSPDDLSVILTDCGLEVESIEWKKKLPKNEKGKLIVGEIINCEKHPNADRLSITKVNIGQSELLSIVCGAPNVETGQKVVVARIGANIFKDNEELILQKTKIRGEISEGMICAEDELGLGNSHEGIMVLSHEAVPGDEITKHIVYNEDAVFEIGLTPNRSDATSHLGVARDIVAVLNCRNKSSNKVRIPDVNNFKVDNNNLIIPVIIEDKEACPRYTGLTITGVQIKDSPEWLREKLNSIDIRPINNVVDITNYILFETGQPLHAFDADKITGDKVIIKKPPKGTKFTTLDNTDRELTGKDLMICNTVEGMCIAGVFGGIKSGVTENTRNIFLESAYFDPATIRITSRHHGLKTDASFRFERGSDINITEYAIKRAALLIKEIAGGEISSEISDECFGNTDKFEVTLKYSKISSLIGKVIEKEIIRNILNSLEIDIIHEDSDNLLLAVPTSKVDVTRDVDVIEEILRIYGYNNIEVPGDISFSLNVRSRPDKEQIKNKISDYLSGNGFYEIMTNSISSSELYEKNSFAFDPQKNVRILNPLSRELNIMRQSLIFGGLQAINYNRNRKNPDLKLYEFGNLYSYNSDKKSLEKYSERNNLSLFMTGLATPENWRSKPLKSDIYSLKHYVDTIINKLGINKALLKIKNDEIAYLGDQLSYYYNEKLICITGEIQEKICNSLDIKETVHFASFEWDNIIKIISDNAIHFTDIARFPEVRRDLALLVNREVTWEKIENIAFKVEKRLLKRMFLFDIYEDDKMQGKKSYAVAFILQDIEKTLTEEEIDNVMKKLIKAFDEQIGATLR